MELVRVKSKVGNFDIRRRTQICNEQGQIERYEVKQFFFSPDYVTDLPKEVFESLSEEMLDRSIGLTYREALRTL